jgi:hypothetical protein
MRVPGQEDVRDVPAADLELGPAWI